MQRLLFDQGLPGGTKMGTALRTLGLEAYVVGESDAPPNGSSDDQNCRWCSERGAILVTHDRGKKDREIVDVLNRHQVGVILILKNLRTQPPHHLARAVLSAEGKLDQLATGRRPLHHVLRPTGNLAPRNG